MAASQAANGGGRRRARSFRSAALILKRRNFAEADRFLTIFTPRHGKLGVLAPGTRKFTSRKSGHLELLMHSELLLRQGRTFCIVQQAEMIEAFPRLREDLLRGAYGLYIADLLDNFFLGEEDGEQTAFFATTLAALQALCDDRDARLVLRHYELQLLAIVGFRPELTRCLVTGSKLAARDHFFSKEAGGVLSWAGRAQFGDARPISLEMLKLLRYLQRTPYSRVKSLQVSARLHAATEALMQGFIASLLERRLASVRFLDDLQRRMRQAIDAQAPPPIRH